MFLSSLFYTFSLFFLILCICASSISFAMNEDIDATSVPTFSRSKKVVVDDSSSRSDEKQELDELTIWNEMHSMVEFRSFWHQRRVATLQDESIPLRDRFQKALDVSNANEDALPRPKLSAKRGLEYMQKNHIKVVLSDLMFTSFVWDFLERTVSHYIDISQSDQSLLKTVLGPLSREMENLGDFALGDLKQDAKSPYAKDEYLLTQTLLEFCGSLADFYGVEVAKPNTALDAETRTVVSDSEGFFQRAMQDPENVNTFVEAQDARGEKQSPYYMDRLIYYRKHVPASPDPLPHRDDPQLLAFNEYILPASGSNLDEVLKEALPRPKPSSQKSESANLKHTQPKKSSKKRGKSKPSRKGTTPKNSQPERKVKEVVSVHLRPSVTEGKLESSSDEKEEGGVIQSKAVVDEPVLDKSDLELLEMLPSSKSTSESQPVSTSTSALKSKTKLSFNLTSKELDQGWMMVSKSDRTSSSRNPTHFQLAAADTNMRQVRLNIRHHTSTDYILGGKKFTTPLLDKFQAEINPDFLCEIKRMLHHAPKSDRLPNMAQGFLRFHTTLGGKSSYRDFPLEGRYCSGGKFFGKSDLDFKDSYFLMTGMQDFLDPNEKDVIYKLPMNQKGIPLGKAMESKLRRKIIGGAWKKNCLDSEALLFLDLVDTLPQILKSLSHGKSKDSFTIDGAVIGIASYYDSCSRCQQLSQGFQWNLASILSKNSQGRYKVSDSFGSLVISSGQTAPGFVEDVPSSKVSSDLVILKPGRHTFVGSRVASGL